MLSDFVRETISAGGTGNLTLAGAPSGYVTFNAAFGVGPFFLYCAQDGNNREIGRGHLSASTTLVRDRVLVTLSSGTLDTTSPSALNLSTATVVFVAANEAAMRPSGRNLPRKMVTLGASFLATGINNSGTTYANTVNGWWCWMQALLGHPFQHLVNAAVSGHTAAQIAGKVQAIEDYMPCTILLDGGHNNIMVASQGDVAQAIADMGPLMDYLHDRGNSVIFVPTGPLDNSYSGGEGYSDANQSQLLQLNAWLARKCADLGFIFIDSYEAVMDATSVDGEPVANATYDGWHYAQKGAYLVGEYVADKLAGLVPSRYPLVTSQLDDSNVTDGNAEQAVPNPMHTTTSGGTAGTGASGTVAGSRICQRFGAGGTTAVCSVVARADGFGSDQRMVITSTANNDAFTCRTFDFASELANSDIIEVACAVSVSSIAALKALYLYVAIDVGGTTYNLYDLYPLGAGDWLTSGTYDDLVLKTQRFQLPASGAINSAIAYVIATFSASGGATVDIGRWSCRILGDAPSDLLLNYTS